MIELDFLRQLDRLSLIVNKRITSNYSGENVSDYVGKGIVFKDYVIYSQGDDFRSVDWKVFARTDKLFSRRYEEERNLTVHVILDYSSSMGFKTGKLSKIEYASMIALGFSYMALKNNERFAMATFADKLEVHKPKRGRKQLMALMESLNENKVVNSSKFEQSMMMYKKLLNTKGFVVVISDFLYDTEEVARVLKRFKKHEVRLIQVLDPVETDLELEGDYKLKDLETNEEMRTYVNSLLRKKYLESMKEHQAKISKSCDEIGAKFFTFSTAEPIFDCFYKILQKDNIRR